MAEQKPYGCRQRALDFSKPAAVTWYQDQLAHLLRFGASAIKTDFRATSLLNRAPLSLRLGTVAMPPPADQVPLAVPSETPSMPGGNLTQWFAEEVLPHSAPLKAYLRGSFPSVRDVEDVVQESFLRVWRRQVARPIESARGFLFQVARRVALDTLRHERASPFLDVAESARLAVAEDRPAIPETVCTTEEVALLVGEAHFQVAKDPARPFVVTAGATEVRAVGTGFSVELAAAGIDIVVTEGRVGVAPLPVADRPAAEVRPKIFLGARERTLVPYAVTPGKPPSVQTLAAAEFADRLAWRGVRLEFTDTPLREAVDLMNRHASGEHRVRLVVNDPELARTPITGLFRADNTETFVDLLATSFGGRAERTGDTIVLHPAR